MHQKRAFRFPLRVVVMWVWLRMVLALVVVLMPGGFPLLLAYVATRTLLARWRVAQAQAQAVGRDVSLRDVVATLQFRELVREARASLGGRAALMSP